MTDKPKPKTFVKYHERDALAKIADTQTPELTREELAEIQPHAMLGLPKEDKIRELVLNRPMTLKNVERGEPRLVELAIIMLKEGVSISQTARATELRPDVIREIRIKYEKQIGCLRGKTKEDFRLLAKMTQDALFERVQEGEMTPQQLGVIMGIATEKAELLDGNATQRVEKVEKEKFDDMEAVFAKMKKAKKPDIHDV